MAETFIDRLIADHDASGRAIDCDIRVWAEQKQGELKVIRSPKARAVRERLIWRELLRRPDWLPQWSARAIWVLRNEPDPERAMRQWGYFKHIRDNPRPETVALIRSILNMENGAPGSLSPGVAARIADWMEQEHPGKGRLMPRLRRAVESAPAPPEDV